MFVDLAALPGYTLPQWLIVAVYPVLLLGAALSDAATMRIPNWLTGMLALAFPLASAGTALPLSSFGLHIAIGAGALLLGMAVFAAGWVGGGDAKLFAAISLWLGPEHMLTFGIVAALLGGMLTLALLVFRRLPLPAPLAAQAWLLRLHDPDAGAPYGLALAAGGLVAFAQSGWLAGAA